MRTKVILSLFLLFTLMVPTLSRGQAVIHFSEQISKLCKSNNSILGKKIFLTILKLEKRSDNPCGDFGLKMLLKSCAGGGMKCPTIIAQYNEAIFKFEGRVVGQ